MQYVQRAAATGFALTAGALILFATVKGTKPSGAAVLPILWIGAVASPVIWGLAEWFKVRDESESAKTGSQKMNRLIYRQWRALKRRRRLRRLLRRPPEVEHIVVPGLRTSNIPAPQVRLQLAGSQDPPKSGATSSIQDMRREAARRAVQGTPQERKLHDLQQQVQALSERDDQRPVSDAHRDTLKGVARTLRSYLDASQHAYYGGLDDERQAQAFEEHFPDVAGRITAWNEQIAALEAERRELQEWVERRLRLLAYDQPPFAWGYAGLIAELAVVDGAELPFHVLQLQPLWLHLGVYAVAPEPPPNGRTREGIEDELRGVLAGARQQPQCAQIRQIRDSLSEASEPLISELGLIQAKDVINGVGGCVLCR